MPGRSEPYSEPQRRWAFAAERRGDLPKGTAIRWSKRAAKRRDPDSPKLSAAGGRAAAAVENAGWFLAAGVLGLGLVIVLASKGRA